MIERCVVYTIEQYQQLLGVLCEAEKAALIREDTRAVAIAINKASDMVTDFVVRYCRIKRGDDR